nr:hypothetical protein [Tanacetum cinerariifolium]
MWATTEEQQATTYVGSSSSGENYQKPRPTELDCICIMDCTSSLVSNTSYATSAGHTLGHAWNTHGKDSGPPTWTNGRLPRAALYCCKENGSMVRNEGGCTCVTLRIGLGKERVEKRTLAKAEIQRIAAVKRLKEETQNVDARKQSRKQRRKLRMSFRSVNYKTVFGRRSIGVHLGCLILVTDELGGYRYTNSGKPPQRLIWVVTRKVAIKRLPNAALSSYAPSDMDLFNLIRAPNPTKVKIGTRPRAAHEVSLLTVTASRVIEMKDPAAATDSYRVPSTIERSPLDFANENPSQQSTGGDETKDQEAGLVEEISAMGPRVIKERRKRRNDGVDVNAPPKVLRKDHADSRPMQSNVRGKSLASMGLGTGSTFLVPTPRETPADVSDPDPLSFANPSSKGAAVVGDPESENTSFTSMVGSPESIYQPEWGVTNSCRLDTPKAGQDLVDYIAPPGYFLEMCHLHNDNFLRQYNIILARQVAMGSQLRL